jgi:acyl carrier protein
MPELFPDNAIVLDLRRTVAEVLDCDEKSIGYDTRFIEDLGVDSLMALEVLVSLETRYNVKLGEDELKQLTCLRNVHELLAAKTVMAPPAPRIAS